MCVCACLNSDFKSSLNIIIIILILIRNKIFLIAQNVAEKYRQNIQLKKGDLDK